MNYRLYSFVAHHYLSQLQCGLQTAHVVSELSRFKINTPQHQAFSDWAVHDKTIIILGAGNHAGVENASTLLLQVSRLNLPYAIFYEDEQSMNSMATACGIVVPECIWGAKMISVDDPNAFTYEFIAENGERVRLTPAQVELKQILDSYRLA